MKPWIRDFVLMSPSRASSAYLKTALTHETPSDFWGLQPAIVDIDIPHALLYGYTVNKELGGQIMADRRNVILPVAAALGALTSTMPATQANAGTPPNAAVVQPTGVAQLGQANTFVSTGRDLLAFTINEQPDGTIVAQHQSHASHASHTSHHSHYSSR
jgi:hypothetical protein